ncbi:MAG: potassium channel family protein [Pseudomonadota bacterium]
MLSQLLLGSLLISATIIVEVCFIGMAAAMLTRIGSWLATGRKLLKLMLSLVAVVLWMLAAISIGVWIWAAAFLVLEQFQELETALYFAVVSMTTLGYGDIVIGKEWRLLSGLIAANGLILFSLATAFFIEFITRLRKAQSG